MGCMASGDQGTGVRRHRDFCHLPECHVLFVPWQGLRVCNMLEGGVTPLHTPAELKSMGFHIALYPLSGLYAATRAMLNVYGSLANKVRHRPLEGTGAPGLARGAAMRRQQQQQHLKGHVGMIEGEAGRWIAPVSRAKHSGCLSTAAVMP